MSKETESKETESKEEGVEVLLVVPHERVRATAWAERAGDRVRVLADGGFQVSGLYGVAFQMRIHADTSNTPGTFVIDAEGVLRWSHVGTGPKNWGDRPTVAEILRQVQAAQAPAASATREAPETK